MTLPRQILLVDSSAVLHRCYHGYPEKHGFLDQELQPMEALFGYMQYTHRLYQDFEFDEIVHVLDAPDGSAYRRELYPEYKAQRPPTPEDLAQQKPHLPMVLQSLGQKIVQIPGVESDDILGYYAKYHAKKGDIVMILSPDKDILQLVVDGSVTVAKYVEQPNGEGGKVHQFFDEKAVFVKHGVRPDQIPDYLAILGDSSDNIPGVYKAGAKTASKWLETYGDLETLITNAQDIKGKIGENLRLAIPTLPLYKKLTTLLVDIQVPLISDLSKNYDKLSEKRVRDFLNLPDHWTFKSDPSERTRISKEETIPLSAKAQESANPIDSKTSDPKVSSTDTPVRRSAFPRRGAQN